MIWALTLHLGVIMVVFSIILLGFNTLTGAYYPDSDSVRENYRILAGFLLVGGILIAIGGIGMILSH